MKKEFDKACKELAKIAKGRPSKLEYCRWPSGMGDTIYSKGHYSAYIEGYQMSQYKNTAMEAVEELKEIVRRADERA